MNIGPLTQGRIVKRYKRFLADVILADGTPVTVHCPNTGSMQGCWKPDAPVELSYSTNPKRKYCWTLERVDMGNGWVGVNTARTNSIIREGIQTGVIDELKNYKTIQSEPRYVVDDHRPSRFDFLLSRGERKDAYVEVKNTTYLVANQMQFPDAVSERARKHLDLLFHAVKRGYRGVIVFALNRPEGNGFAPARDIDPEYADTLKKVTAQGVEAIAVRLRHTKSGIEVANSVSVNGSS